MIDYARHTSDRQVHLLDLDEGQSLCGLDGIFERVETSDATRDGLCDECDSTDEYIYR